MSYLYCGYDHQKTPTAETVTKQLIPYNIPELREKSEPVERRSGLTHNRFSSGLRVLRQMATASGITSVCYYSNWLDCLVILMCSGKICEHRIAIYIYRVIFDMLLSIYLYYTVIVNAKRTL